MDREESEPTTAAAPELQSILAELSARELIIHGAELGTTRDDFKEMMAEDFWETGASGSVYSRQVVLDVLEKRSSAPRQDAWEASNFACRRLAEDVYLLTYTLLQQHTRLTRRASIWQKKAEGWKIVYHQGTIVQGS